MDDRQFKKLLDSLGLSWEGYYRVRKGVKKRIRKHMQQCNCRDIETYLALLAGNPRIEAECRLLLTVSISRFFRDRELWQTLENEILPDLISRHCDEIRVWSAGCARGEEIYSFKILWEDLSNRLTVMPKLKAWATDINSEYLAAAHQGVYSASSLKEIPAKLKERYFEPLKRSQFLTLQDSIRQGILWKTLDLLNDDPPAEGLHLIFLRNNILTYYSPPLLQPALKKVTESLELEGYLIIGAKEKLPGTATNMQPYSRYPQALIRRDRPWRVHNEE